MQPFKSFPSKSNEKLGRWVGIAKNQGDVLTYLIMDDENGCVIPRSVVRSAVHTDDINLAPLYTGDEENSPGLPHIQSVTDLMPPEVDPKQVQLPTFSPAELLGRDFIFKNSDGEPFKGKVIKRLNDLEGQNNENIKFIVEVADGEFEEIMSYLEVNDAVENQAKEKFHTFKEITGHHGPMKPNDPNYKGSKYNVEIEWTDGTRTWEPLNHIAADDPIEAARYAKKNKLLNKPGWKKLRPIANRLTVLFMNINKGRINIHEPQYKFGVQVPFNTYQANKLDQKNDNHKWRDARKVEITQLFDYEVFRDLGKGAEPPPGYKKITVRVIYDVKHDLRHKARCVAQGNLTDPCGDQAYSGVISLLSLRLAILIGKLNGLKIMVGDIGNAYLEAFTQEKSLHSGW